MFSYRTKYLKVHTADMKVVKVTSGRGKVESVGLRTDLEEVHTGENVGQGKKNEKGRGQESVLVCDGTGMACELAGWTVMVPLLPES